MPPIVPNLWFDSQAELDYYFNALTGGCEQESQCGWLRDRFDLSWQVPLGMEQRLSHADPARDQRAMQAMLGMRRIDLKAIESAADGG